ncbi:type II toxin-antitoxin system RelE/ParE family toxin [Mycobacterium sp.]|uniref:type II toxin-antitoxin system RelE/ParE family toxin n=1 Tax=Mycobacterium sp. TaxID=1785 RepID=UPI002BE89B5C|nr:type II toxin-antitoxin system RelE/ParE family toxin [Mycobacterium sp.]HTQ22296.1 type II toxin-antitoxin system RelE/ParE family toxin [Mycobacterium sp.]
MLRAPSLHRGCGRGWPPSRPGACESQRRLHAQGGRSARRPIPPYCRRAGSAEAAARYTEGIVAYCEELATFPHRGSGRDDIRSGLRTIGFRRRVVIAFAVLDQTVAISGVIYGGRERGGSE